MNTPSADHVDPTAPFPVTPVPPDLQAWARQTSDAQEFLDGVREIESTGGRPLEAYIAGVESAAGGS